MDIRIQVVLKLIDRNLRARYDACAMAKEVNLSVSRFYELFRRETGTAPVRYVRDLRLHTATELLRNSHLSVKEIADSVGIHDLSHFVRDFENRYGTSPRRYRVQGGRSETSQHAKSGPENWLINRNFS